MIPEKINSIFIFIDYLHSNINYYNSFQNTFDKINELKNKSFKLKPKENFKHKSLHDKILNEINQECEIVKINIINPLIEKITLLNICDYTNVATISSTIENWNLPEIENLKSNFNEQDVNTILLNKRLYNDYKISVQTDFYQDFFFSNFDKILNELFDFFTPIENKHFDSCENYADKIKYWLSIKDEYIFENPDITLVGCFEIPKHFYDEYFYDALNNPEYTFLALKENANKYFDWYLKEYKIEEQIKSPIGLQFINAELNKLYSFEVKTNKLIEEKTINYTDKNIKAEFNKETELMRLKSRYYKVNALPFVNAIGHNAVICYAEHFLLKDYLESNRAVIQNPYISGQNPFDKLFEVTKVSNDKLKYFLENKANDFVRKVQKEQLWNGFKDFIANKFNLNENNIIWEFVTNENFDEYLPSFFAQLSRDEKATQAEDDSWNVNSPTLEFDIINNQFDVDKGIIHEKKNRNEIKTRIKKNLNSLFDYCYNILIVDYLDKNPLAEEVDFINYIYENQTLRMNEIKPLINFSPDYDSPDLDGHNLILKDEYWCYFEYQNYLKAKLIEINKTTSKVDVPLIKSNKNHPPYDTNLWSIECYELFKYLIEKYFNRKSIQLVHIWHFLRYIKEPENDKYRFKVKQHEFTKIASEFYKINISKYDKYQWDIEKEVLKGHFNNYKKELLK